jgi:DNA repair photolyase
VSFLPLLGQRSGPTLSGIARLAAEGDNVGVGHHVEYLSLEARSILNRCTSPRMPFTWTVNPYRGCEFACKYCYARYTHEFMELRDGLDFERKIYVKQRVASLLRRDLRRVKSGEGIAIGTATDPYQPAERKYGATRAILDELALHAGLDISIISKSHLILRDRDVLARLAERHDLSITITVTTVDTDLARILEPRAPRPDLRLRAVRMLRDAGLDVGVMCAPVVPGITDDPAGLDALVAAAAGAGARRVHGNPLFLKPCSAQVFMPFLEESFPHLVERYRRRYTDRAFVSSEYRRYIRDLLSRLRRKHGMATDRTEEKSAAPQADQLALF